MFTHSSSYARNSTSSATNRVSKQTSYTQHQTLRKFTWSLDGSLEADYICAVVLSHIIWTQFQCFILQCTCIKHNIITNAIVSSSFPKDVSIPCGSPDNQGSPSIFVSSHSSFSSVSPQSLPFFSEVFLLTCCSHFDLGPSLSRSYTYCNLNRFSTKDHCINTNGMPCGNYCIPQLHIHKQLVTEHFHVRLQRKQKFGNIESCLMDITSL